MAQGIGQTGLDRLAVKPSIHVDQGSGQSSHGLNYEPPRWTVNPTPGPHRKSLHCRTKDVCDGSGLPNSYRGFRDGMDWKAVVGGGDRVARGAENAT